MKLKLSCILPLTLFISLQCFAQSEGDYVIFGNDPQYGQYVGQGWIKNGVVQRLIQYEDFKYENNSIEEVWNGTVNKDLTFSLRQSNLLTSFNGYSPNDESFKSPINVQLPADVFNNTVIVNVGGKEIREEWTYAGKVNNEPLWKDLRNKREALGQNSKILNVISKFAYIEKVIDIYRELPALGDYREREEFKSRKHYIFRDKTDADFYLQNPNVLRITNKTTNPLSLAEALMKKNAFGKTLLEKENYLRAETLKYNFNKAGMLETGIIDNEGNQVGRHTEYDSALWTAMFGWAELLRYQVTKDPEAMKNFRTVLDAELTLLEIHPDPKEFARSLAISPVGENLGEGWIQGEGKYSHLKWRQGGNNDMIKGVFITLVLAHQVVKSDEVELIKRIQKIVPKLPEITPVAERPYNKGTAEGIVALWTKDEKKLKKFHDKNLGILNNLGKINNFGTGLYWGGIADWSGINLGMVTNFSQMLLARELKKVFPNEKSVSKMDEVQKDAEDKLVTMFNMYKNSRRDFLPIMIWNYIPEFQKDPKNKEEVKEALWSLREVPAPRSFGNAKADLSKHPEWSFSGWPRQPWKAIAGFRKLKEDFDYYNLRQGAYGYPIYEGLAWGCSYFWKNSPYEYKFESNAAVKTFSADYLLIYWASRASGLITSNE